VGNVSDITVSAVYRLHAFDTQQLSYVPASEMTYTVSGGALNSTQTKPDGRTNLLSCVELLWGRRQPIITGRLATHPGNTTEYRWLAYIVHSSLDGRTRMQGLVGGGVA